MFTATGFTDLTFILNFYYQIVCPPCKVNIPKYERVARKQKLKTVPISSKMKFRKNIVPAGLESDDEYDEFGEYIEKKTYHVKPQAEDFKLTLQNACMSNNVPEIIRALNSSSIDINSHLEGNWTALLHAAFNGSLDAVKCLLHNGADPLAQYDCHNVIMCVCNCKNNNSNEIDLLNCLKLVANFDKIDINSADRVGLSALMYACSNGWLKLVEFLVDHDADVEMKDNQNGETALFFAVRFNHVDVVKFLLSRGADKDVTDKKNHTVYRIAENKNMVDILNLLDTDHTKEQLQVYYSEEHTYWDVVMTEIENGFNKDLEEFLENLSMEFYAKQLKSNNVTFKCLLSANKDQFVDMGIILSPHCKLLATALKSFHTWRWSGSSLGVKKDQIDAESIAQILASVIRQLHILDAQIMYLGNHSHGLDPQKGEEAMRFLMNIRTTEDKIFRLLDKQVRVSRVDYMGSHKLRKQNVKMSIKEKVFVGTAVILVLLRII